MSDQQRKSDHDYFLAERVKNRAFAIWQETGCTDSQKNYFQALGEVENNHPILVGSLALKLQGVKLRQQEPRDIDLIVDRHQAEELAWQCQEKKSPGQSAGQTALLKFSENMVDLALYTSNPFDQLLWQKMAEICTITGQEAQTHEICLDPEYHQPPYTLKVRIPPLTWLYVMLRGHLHRIPKISSSQSSNIKIWEKWMAHYQAIRQKLGYKHLDQQLATDPTLRQLYETQFDHITQLLGDAPSLDKAEEVFFDDHVKRYLPHDQLHEEVALINRGTRDLLFRKFQSNPDSVEMDRDLFLVAPRNEQLNTIREELMVLYLERKLLPQVVEHGSKLENLDPVDFRETVCHFITNLCGQGHYWLRQWCLDHYHLVKDLETYPVAKMSEFALTYRVEGRVLGVLNFESSDEDDNNDDNSDSDDNDESDDMEKQMRNETVKDRRIRTFEQFMQYANKVKNHPDNENQSIANNLKLESNKEAPDIDLTDKKTKNKLNIPGYLYKGINSDRYNNYELDCQVVDVSLDLDKLALGWVDEIITESDQMHTLSKNIVSSYVSENLQKTLYRLFDEGIDMDGVDRKDIIIIENENDSLVVIYNLKEGLGLVIDEDYVNCYLFLIESTCSGDNDEIITFGVHRYFIDLNKYENLKDGYKNDVKTGSYYRSTCDGGYNREVDLEYVNHFGEGYAELDNLTELLARTYLQRYKDEETEDYYDY